MLAIAEWSYVEYALAHTFVEQINQWQNLTLEQWEKMELDSTTASANIDLTYDAWDRLVKVVRYSKTLGEYVYDALNRRTIKKEYDDAGILSATRHYYYSTDWQVLEERIDSDTAPDRQYVWGLRYVDDLVLRDRDTTGSGTLDERLYSLGDANWNVIALADTSGVVQERYAYDAYGNVSILTDSYANRDTSSYDWNYFFTTRELDPESGLFNYRNRYYDSLSGRFISRDPIVYEGSKWNLYEYVSSQPMNLTDPTGEVAPLVIACGAACAGCFTCAGPGLITCFVISTNGEDFEFCWDTFWKELPPWHKAACFGVCVGCGVCARKFFKKLRKPRKPKCRRKPDNRKRCKPCGFPSNPIEIHMTPDQHGCFYGHWHYWKYNQIPWPSCQCKPQRKFGGCLDIFGNPISGS